MLGHNKKIYDIRMLQIIISIVSNLTLSRMESKIEHSGWGGGLITPATSTTQDFA